MPKLYNPDGVFPPQASYSHAGFVKAGGDTLYIAGQLGIDADGNVGDGIQEQAALAFGNIAKILADAGMGPEHLVKTQVFLTEREYRAEIGEAREALLQGHRPVSTLLVIKSLAAPEFLIEVEAVAVRD